MLTIMNELLKYANEKNITIGAFNVTTLENLMIVLYVKDKSWLHS